MSKQRYQAEPDGCGDWAVVDTNRRNQVVARGLSLEEAEKGANARNQSEDQEKAQYLENNQS